MRRMLVSMMLIALMGLALLAGVAIVLAHVVFGAGITGMHRMQEATDQIRWPAALIRLVIGAVVFWAWPSRFLPRLAARNAWSEPRLKKTQRFHRQLIGAAIAFDLIVMNIPLWLGLFGR